jgi:acyl dehydratase
MKQSKARLGNRALQRRIRMAPKRGMYYDEFNVGDEFSSPARTITEADIVMFAGLSGDYNQLHTDEEFGKKTQFGKRIAHGLLGLSISSGLTQRTGVTDGTVVAFLGLEWKFLGPIFIGDTIHVIQKVATMRETKKPDRGIINFDTKVINQDGAVVQEGVRTVMISRKTTE